MKSNISHTAYTPMDRINEEEKYSSNKINSFEPKSEELKKSQALTLTTNLNSKELKSEKKENNKKIAIVSSNLSNSKKSSSLYLNRKQELNNSSTPDFLDLCCHLDLVNEKEEEERIIEPSQNKKLISNLIKKTPPQNTELKEIIDCPSLIELQTPNSECESLYLTKEETSAYKELFQHLEKNKKENPMALDRMLENELYQDYIEYMGIEEESNNANNSSYSFIDDLVNPPLKIIIEESGENSKFTIKDSFSNIIMRSPTSEGNLSRDSLFYSRSNSLNTNPGTTITNGFKIITYSPLPSQNYR